MGLSELTVPGPAGLDLRPGAPAAAMIDCANIVLDDGVIRSRAGSVALGPIGAPTSLVSPQPVSIECGRLAGSDLAVIAQRTAISVLDLGAATAVQQVAAMLADTPISFARVGTPTQEALFVTAGGGQVWRVVGPAAGDITQPAVTYDGAASGNKFGFPRLLAVTPWDQRLLMAGYVNAANSGPGLSACDPAMVRASEPADPVTLKSNAFFRVGSGDGEDLTAMCTWRDATYIFQADKFWVLTGISAGADGAPVFARRPVEAGVGAVAADCVAAAPDALYFVARDGVYRTTGELPVKVSGPIDPLVNYDARTGPGARTVHGAYDQVGKARWSLRYIGNDQVLLNVPATGGNPAIQLVLDTQTGGWTLWELPAIGWARTPKGRPCFIDEPRGAGAQLLWALDPDQWGDFNAGSLYTAPARATVAMLCRRRSGWIDYGNPDIKVLYASKVWTTARSLGRKLYSDLDRAGPAAYTVSAPALAGHDVGVALIREAARATRFSEELAFRAGLNSVDPTGIGATVASAVSVHRVTHHVGGMANPSDTRAS